MGIYVSDVTLKDKSGWEDLYQEYAEFYEMPMDQQILDTVWGWIQSEKDEFYCIIARDKNQTPIGFMHYRSMFSPLRGTKVGYLDDLFLSPAYRGTGTVEKLFEALDVRAQQNDWPFVRWITADDNCRAQAVYNKLSERTKWVTYQKSTGG
ncbi:MAG: GNAT family N-acetyltransferase [Pseudomonadales bacterium]|nr:GNAT family N-acetyltransferase [Pseudomonadales bacterium]